MCSVYILVQNPGAKSNKNAAKQILILLFLFPERATQVNLVNEIPVGVGGAGKAAKDKYLKARSVWL